MGEYLKVENQVLRSLTEENRVWQWIEAHAKEGMAGLRSPPESDAAIVSDRLLHLDEDGLPKARCWRVLFKVLVDVHVKQYGIERAVAIKHVAVAIKHVMATTA